MRISVCNGVKLIRLLLLLFLAFNSCGCDLTWWRYYNKEHRFSLALPLFWQKKAGGMGDTVFMAQQGQASSRDRFSENINVSVVTLPSDISLSTFFELSRDELLYNLMTLDIEEGDTMAGFLPGKWLSFHARMKDLQLHILSAVFVKGGRAYIITCSSEEEKFPHYKPIFTKIINSLRIK